MELQMHLRAQAAQSHALRKWRKNLLIIIIYGQSVRDLPRQDGDEVLWR